MPLAIRDYSWEETDKSVFITVPLKGAKANKVDILSSEEYIKVCICKYIFLLENCVGEEYNFQI